MSGEPSAVSRAKMCTANGHRRLFSNELIAALYVIRLGARRAKEAQAQNMLKMHRASGHNEERPQELMATVKLWSFRFTRLSSNVSIAGRKRRKLLGSAAKLLMNS